MNIYGIEPMTVYTHDKQAVMISSPQTVSIKELSQGRELDIYLLTGIM